MKKTLFCLCAALLFVFAAANVIQAQTLAPATPADTGCGGCRRRLSLRTHSSCGSCSILLFAVRLSCCPVCFPLRIRMWCLPVLSGGSLSVLSGGAARSVRTELVLSGLLWLSLWILLVVEYGMPLRWVYSSSSLPSQGVTLFGIVGI